MTNTIYYFSPGFCIEYGWHRGTKKYFIEKMQIQTRKYQGQDGLMIPSTGWYGLGIKFYTFFQFRRQLKEWKVIV